MNNKKKTYTRSDIESSLRKEFSNISKTDLNAALNIILDSITEAVALDEKVEIRGFGTFSKKVIRPRRFLNPKTKRISYLGETSIMHFKPFKSLIEK